MYCTKATQELMESRQDPSTGIMTMGQQSTLVYVKRNVRKEFYSYYYLCVFAYGISSSATSWTSCSSLS